MGRHHEMGKHYGPTQVNSSQRVANLAAQGHHLSIDSTPGSATITITRKEGYAHHITTTPSDLTEQALNSPAYRRNPQTVLIAHAIHAIAEWSEQQDTGNLSACFGCGHGIKVHACYNPITRGYDWYCHTCFYGEAA